MAFRCDTCIGLVDDGQEGTDEGVHLFTSLRGNLIEDICVVKSAILFRGI